MSSTPLAYNIQLLLQFLQYLFFPTCRIPKQNVPITSNNQCVHFLGKAARGNFISFELVYAKLQMAFIGKCARTLNQFHPSNHTKIIKCYLPQKTEGTSQAYSKAPFTL